MAAKRTHGEPAWMIASAAALRAGVSPQHLAQLALSGKVKRERRELSHAQTTPRWWYLRADVERIRKERRFTGFQYHYDISREWVSELDASIMLKQGLTTTRAQIADGTLKSKKGCRFNLPRPWTGNGVSWKSVMTLVMAQRQSSKPDQYTQEVIEEQTAVETVVPTFGPITDEEQLADLKELLVTVNKAKLKDPGFVAKLHEVINEASRQSD